MSLIPVTDAITFFGAFAVAFLMTFLILPWLILKMKARGIVGTDRNKPNHPEVAEMGGIAVVIGVFAGVSILLAFDGVTDLMLLNVSLAVVLGAAFVGMIDDLFELQQRQKAFFPFLLALPLGAALDPVVFIPYIGNIDFGVLMILAAPFAITCAANAGNMLEGFNGLGAGLGIIMALTLVVLALLHDRLDGVYLLVPLAGGLMAFLWYNRYPSKVFPGDALMLFMGATLAVSGMMSQLYIQTTIIFLPMIAEFFLKLRGSFEGENYCSALEDGYLEYHGRVESITHLFMMKMRLTERRLVALIWLIETMICVAVIAIDVSL